MFSRCTTIKSKQSGGPYQTYRLVESERLNGKVKQRTVLNQGRHFDLPKSQWSDLSSRIAQLLSAQEMLFSIELPTELEALAQRYAAQILVLERCRREIRGSLSRCPWIAWNWYGPAVSGLNNSPSMR